ncbi:hypothetical protein [Burkholderia cepacia]|uniref:hypothetical protein n=1 Tax=Burkholderia cepacia TaxID=292 RepID=UPI001CF5D685|nr:hypothetical protein [Burkholderia cepacia]MCA8331862.1 hypothetical protein [Burkholderia cepacia]
MDRKQFDEIYPVDIEGIKSADQQAIDRIRSAHKDTLLSAIVKAVLVAVIAVAALSDNGRAHVGAILVALWILGGKLNQILAVQTEIRLEQERIKGAIRDNRWATFWAQDLTERRIDRAHPESADRF